MQDLHHHHQPSKLHHPSTTHDAAEHGSVSENKTHPLAYHPTDKKEAAEWRAVSEKNRASIENGKNQPHPLTISDPQRQSQIEKDKLGIMHGRSRQEKLAAAHDLVRLGVSSFDLKEPSGANHQYHINDLGDGRLRVSDGGKTIAEDKSSFTEHMSVPHIQGFQRHGFGSAGSYQQPHWADGRSHHVYSPQVDPRFYNMTENPDGSKTLNFMGCAVDTDGASYHPEDKYWQSQTKLTRSDGRPLNTDLDNFVVVSPSQARALGLKQGDRGYLVDMSRGTDGHHPAVPVVVGDQGPEGKRTAEASVHALKQLGYANVDGNNGVDGRRFQIVIYPHSGNGRGDIARSPELIKAQLDAWAARRTTTAV